MHFFALSAPTLPLPLMMFLQSALIKNSAFGQWKDISKTSLNNNTLTYWNKSEIATLTLQFIINLIKDNVNIDVVFCDAPQFLLCVTIRFLFIEMITQSTEDIIFVSK